VECLTGIPFSRENSRHTRVAPETLYDGFGPMVFNRSPDLPSSPKQCVCEDYGKKVQRLVDCLACLGHSVCRLLAYALDFNVHCSLVILFLMGFNHEIS
jgi:hypothetical protein